MLTAIDRPNLMQDISALLNHENLPILAMNITKDDLETTSQVSIRLEIPDLKSLKHILERLKQLPNVTSVIRLDS